MLKKIMLFLIVGIFALIGCAKEEPKPNTPPVISDLTVSQNDLVAGAVAELKCVANDADGDTLIYEWSVSTGEATVEGNANTAKFTAPAKGGKFTIKVVVTDGKGGKAEKETAISVNAAPEISELTAEKAALKPGESTKIKVVAKDIEGDSITIEFSADKGEIKQDKDDQALAIFKAPKTEDTCVITVKAKDSKAAESSKTLEILVSKKPPKK